MQRQTLILLGGGGHCKSVIDVIESTELYEIEGILDVSEKIGLSVLGYPIIGTEDLIQKLSKTNTHFLVTVGQIKTPQIRENLFNKLLENHTKIATIIAPTALVSKHAVIEKGTIVMHRATINAGVIIGRNNIINTASNIEHDVKIGDHCHISTGAIINGHCSIGSGVFVGSNSTLVQGVQIVDDVVIGAGTLVHKSISEPGIYVGTPFRRLG